MSMNKKIKSCYLKNLRRVCASVPLDKPMSKEVFEALWSANFYHIYSSKIAHKIHNTAASMIEENFLRPIGIRHGFIPAEEVSNDLTK